MRRGGLNKKNIAFDKAASVRSIDANGFLHVAMTPISKAMVSPYLGEELGEIEGIDPAAVYYGLRDPDELRAAAATFNGLPLLLNHHEESAENPQKEWRVGSTGTDAEFDGEYLKNSLSVTDKTAIDLIESGEMKEISCAYLFDADFTPGEYKGVKYDFVMRNIKGNHVALVAEGRAGHDVKVADNNIIFKESVQMDNVEAFAKCIQAVEAIREGIDPKELGVEGVTAESGVAEIVDALMKDLTPEEREKKIAYLQYMADFGKEKAEDEEPQEPQKTEEDEFAEKMKDPVFKEAFEMGVKYGERREKKDPGQIDRDHEKTGEERYLKAVGDSAKKIKAAAKAEVMAHVKELTDAARECRAYIGDANPLAFKDAADIYALALKQAGYNPAAYNRASYRDMLSVIKKESHTEAHVEDGAIDDELSESVRKYLY